MRLVVGFAASLAAALLTACASAPPNSQTDQERVRVEGAQHQNSVLLDVDTRVRDVRQSRTVAVPAVAAFDALPDIYRKLGIASVAVIDTAGGVYTVGARNLRIHGSLGGVRLSTYLDCGSAPMHVPANSYDVVFSASTYVTPAGSGSTLHTMVTADARDPMANTPPVRCMSTGSFEQRVAELVSTAR